MSYASFPGYSGYGYPTYGAARGYGDFSSTDYRNFVAAVGMLAGGKRVGPLVLDYAFKAFPAWSQSVKESVWRPAMTTFQALGRDEPLKIGATEKASLLTFQRWLKANEKKVTETIASQSYSAGSTAPAPPATTRTTRKVPPPPPTRRAVQPKLPPPSPAPAPTPLPVFEVPPDVGQGLQQAGQYLGRAMMLYTIGGLVIIGGVVYLATR